MEKELNHYIGDVVNGLAKEAAYWKSRADELAAEIQHLKTTSAQQKKEPDHYISKEPHIG